MINRTTCRLISLSLLASALFLLSGCHSVSQRTLPDRRPGDFTLGVVVFGDEDASDVSSLSARYIVDAEGYLRASVGAGSNAETYPKITRRLSSEQLDKIWDMVNQLALEPVGGLSNGRGWWHDVQSPEQFTAADITETPGQGYLIEIRSNGSTLAWESMIDLGSPTTLIQMLAELAWIGE